MSASPTSPPPDPVKRPYGIVRLPVAVGRTQVAPRAGAGPRGWPAYRWGPRVTLPLLSLRALRGERG